MRIEIQIYKDDGELVASLSEDALRPTDWRTIVDQPIVQGEYKMYGFTYQPQVVRASKAGGY